MPSTAVVILAAGSGTRVGGGVNKVLLPLRGAPILAWSVRMALSLAEVGEIVVVVRREDQADVASALAPLLGERTVGMIEGGRSRHDSEWRALQALAPGIETGAIDVVAVHDAARPIAPRTLWNAVLDAARDRGAAIPAVRVTDLLDSAGLPIRQEEHGAVQTPQAFWAAPLLAAHRAAAQAGYQETDTASVWSRQHEIPIVAVAGSPLNLKVTFPEDLRLADTLASS